MTDVALETATNMLLPSVPQAASTTSSVLSSLTNNVQFVGSAWVLSSSILTTYSTTKFLKYATKKGVQPQSSALFSDGPILNPPLVKSLPRVNQLTLYRFGGSLLLGLLVAPDLQVVQRIQDTWRAVSNFIWPAVFLFLANFSNCISLDKIGIPLTYTTKCGIPLVTVLLTLFLDGTKALPCTRALLSLIPIALGIAAASWNSPTFEISGFIASLISLVSQSCLNISAKRAMAKTGLSGPHAQRAMVAASFCFMVVASLLEYALKCKSRVEQPLKEEPPAWLASLAVAAYHMEYNLSFMFVKLVEPITYGACDGIRRLAIIVSGNFMFKGAPFSALNISGIALALLGALSYSIAGSC